MGSKIFRIWYVICYVSCIDMVNHERVNVHSENFDMCIFVRGDFSNTNTVEIIYYWEYSRNGL